MYKLPHWCITDLRPAFYDTESATAIEQTAKLYKAMNDLIEEYNSFADSTNKIIEDFITGVNQDSKEFKLAMSQQFEEFTGVVELKIMEQDKIIEDSIVYIKNNVDKVCSEVVNGAIKNGDIKISMDYQNEALSINITGGV